VNPLALSEPQEDDGQVISRGERRRRAQAEAARFEGQLTAFGEMLAGHPFATDRPGTTHVMAIEYARALDAYERATREAVRDPALARRELDEGLTALNRLNTHLVGGLPADAAVAEPQNRIAQVLKIPKPKGREAEGERRTGRRPEGSATNWAAATSQRSAAARATGKNDPSGSGRPGVAGGRAKPRLRDRYAPEQLLLRAALTALAGYCVVVGFLTGWFVALICFFSANFGVGLASSGFALCLIPIIQTWGAVKGRRVEAEFSRTKKSFSRSTPWEQHYVHMDADGRELTYRRSVPNESLAPLPTRRLWLVKGKNPELITSTELFLTPLSLILGVPLLLGGTALTLATVPGVLIGALTGHPWW
jgi:hypothetical protein